MNPVKFLASTPKVNLVLILVWMAAIFAGSATPAKEIPPGVGSFSKVLHLAEYAMLGFLIYPYVSWRNMPLLLAAAVATVYGVSDELHQLFVPGRECDFFDALTDCAGSIIGAYASKIIGGR